MTFFVQICYTYIIRMAWLAIIAFILVIFTSPESTCRSPDCILTQAHKTIAPPYGRRFHADAGPGIGPLRVSDAAQEVLCGLSSSR